LQFNKREKWFILTWWWLGSAETVDSPAKVVYGVEPEKEIIKVCSEEVYMKRYMFIMGYI
jgi:hypothetical protein